MCGMPVAIAAEESEPVVVLSIDSVTRVTDVAAYRLSRYLRGQGCAAEIRFDNEPGEVALMFRYTVQAERKPAVLSATSLDGHWPRPAWITRRTSGVPALSELEGRDLATVAGQDPLGSTLPHAALEAVGVHPKPEAIYESGDFSSALGLLLHNNTHAAVSEAGFVGQFLESRDLVITWQGDPVTTVGWYRGKAWSKQALACEEALGQLERVADKQMFAVFPEWVHGFARIDDE
ncbi:PhnD/SsuA/transferrin family substrate-binding protein [Marinobacter salexigens]|uniref:PhnD/SsuA/transferrin family substrate-binding protein n=1 Tax=Marinobacter salexigens TaxID=1925763 RepID=UPI000C2829BF|nr:PhnD/SsuA/transferrin family substrate-binding protein [Marinobacter salexigens]